MDVTSLVGTDVRRLALSRAQACRAVFLEVPDEVLVAAARGSGAQHVPAGEFLATRSAIALADAQIAIALVDHGGAPVMTPEAQRRFYEELGYGPDALGQFERLAGALSRGESGSSVNELVSLAFEFLKLRQEARRTPHVEWIKDRYLEMRRTTERSRD